MKKSIVLLTLFTGLIFSGNLKAQKENKFDFAFGAGFNLMNAVKGNNGEKYDMKSAIPTIYVETHLFPFRGDQLKKIGIGIGIGFYNLKTEDQDMGWLWTYPEGSTGTLYWWPVYLSLKYSFFCKEKFSPYLKLDNGYSIFAISNNIMLPDDRNADASSWGGYYLSMGAGLRFSKIVTIELNYSILYSGIGTNYQYNGYWQYWNEDFKTNMFTISVGFIF